MIVKIIIIAGFITAFFFIFRFMVKNSPPVHTQETRFRRNYSWRSDAVLREQEAQEREQMERDIKNGKY